jgi:23S rRNA C2498 (ribose-2'-O)-methylase RlmM
LGLMNRAIERECKIMDLNLNYAAAEEIVVIPADNTNGHDIIENVPSIVPLSRAYYKLDEIWKCYLSNLVSSTWEWGGIAMDLGACPGGWTQVLVHEMGFQNVLSVDPGILSDRVLNLSQVTHIRNNILSADITSHGPFSILVCDASDVWIKILEQIETVVVEKCEWSLPSVCIITLKLPFKTLKSVKRHVDRIQNVIPVFLQRISRKMFPGKGDIQIQSSIVHLMSNSSSERTLLATFTNAE